MCLRSASFQVLKICSQCSAVCLHFFKKSTAASRTHFGSNYKLSKAHHFSAVAIQVLWAIFNWKTLYLLWQFFRTKNHHFGQQGIVYRGWQHHQSHLYHPSWHHERHPHFLELWWKGELTFLSSTKFYVLVLHSCKIDSGPITNS